MELHEFHQGCAVFTTDGKSPALSVVHTEEASLMCWVKWQDVESGKMRHTVMHMSQLTHVPPPAPVPAPAIKTVEVTAPAKPETLSAPDLSVPSTTDTTAGATEAEEAGDK